MTKPRGVNWSVVSRLNLAWRYLRDPEVSIWPKITTFLAIAYLIWPGDFLPDVFPLAGWLDDAIVATVAWRYLSRILDRYASNRYS